MQYGKRIGIDRRGGPEMREERPGLPGLSAGGGNMQKICARVQKHGQNQS